MATRKLGHGGRRHGLTTAGEATRISTELNDDDVRGLDELVTLFASREGKATRSSVLRQVLRDEIRAHRREVAESPRVVEQLHHLLGTTDDA